MKTNQVLIGVIALTFLFIGYTDTASAAGSAATTTSITAIKYLDQVAVEKRVREYFSETPAMIEIARCESKFRQFTDSGNVLRSNGMIGVFQFYESIHTPGAKALGFDLATLEGNIGYAKNVYSTQGTTPWNGSKYCWETASTPVIYSPASREQLLKQINLLTKLIVLLQRQLALKQLSNS